MEQDDLFQEIIIQVWHSVPNFRGEASVVTWLYRIALNTAIKWTKKERKQVHSETLEGVQHILQEGRMPYLDNDLLEKIVLLHNSKSICTNYLKNDSFMLAKPIPENLLLFLFSHVTDCLHY